MIFSRKMPRRKHKCVSRRAGRRGGLTLHGSHVLYKSRLLPGSQSHTDERGNMAEEAPAPAPTKVAKKRTQRRKDALPIPKLIIGALAESKERRGTSLTAIKKILGDKGVNVPKLNKRINTIMSKMVTNGLVLQTTGAGASGSFKLAKKETVKKARSVEKKSTPSKPKKSAPKPSGRRSLTKKPGDKKSGGKKAGSKKATTPVKRSSAVKSKSKPSPKKSPGKKQTPKKATKKPAAKKPAKAAKGKGKRPAVRKAAPKKTKK